MTAVLDKLEQMGAIAERFGTTLEKLGGLAEKVPRFVEMVGLALFAGRASENAGGRFVDGAVAGAVADGLAHSRLPNNQIGGVALGVYLSGVGLLNILPPELWEEQEQTDPVTGEPLPTARVVGVHNRAACDAMGGTYIETLPSFFGFGLAGCRLD